MVNGDNFVWTSVRRLDRWIEQNGWAGYDPYDIKGTRLFLWLQNNNLSILAKVIGRFVFGVERRKPLFTRRLLGVSKQINAKGIGLFARAYLSLYQLTHEDTYKEKAMFCLNWLERNPSAGYSGFCWGYPFDWQSKVFIPKGTPSAVVSSVVGDAFWSAYKVFGERRYLDICESICEFFVNDLNIDEQPNGSLCFSYTPLDDFHVHNANLFVAEFLVRIGSETGRLEYLDLGVRAADYTLSEQNPDGSLYYWGRVQNHYSPNHIDHYHSGFEIRSLFNVWQQTGKLRFQQGTERYYEFYYNNLLAEINGLVVPKMTPTSLYPINIHSCAEAILCNATLSHTFPEAKIVLSKICTWTLSTMQHQDGWFIYMIHKKSISKGRIEIPYMRWGQAWMLLALSQFLTTQEGK